MLEVEQDARRGWMLADIGDFGFVDRRLNHRNHPCRRGAEIDIEKNLPPPCQCFAGAAAQNQKLALHQHAVRHHHGFAVARLDRSRAPAHVDNAPGEVVDFEPVADAHRVVELHREAADDVAERVLH